MGDGLLLITPRDQENVIDLLSDLEDLVFSWFQSVDAWRPEVVAKKRLTWLRCYGIPLHAWKEDVFSSRGGIICGGR
jgi:hypothetical protein